ncbi:hypothetical protein JCGZ_10412 [Jatropha curcas]|uniref:Uncharacterized protein n=1 Tax=Jatropha curcas TaxID=180498 RepID=A0A067KHU6_JATCU|nr:hypothetical protein JCGZ_10412 [Jatropha curcas]
MDRCFVHLSDQSSPCLPIEPFKHNEKTYLGLKIFADVIDVLAVEPKGQKLEKEEEVKKRKEGIEGPKKAETKNEEEQAAQKDEKENKKESAIEVTEDPADQVLKAIKACIEESFEEAKSPSAVLISDVDENDCDEPSYFLMK